MGGVATAQVEFFPQFPLDFIPLDLLVFPMTACGQNKAEENGTAGGIETIPATDTTETVRGTGTAPDDTGSEPAAEGIRENCLAIP